jgi:hypothetical protein
MDHRPDTTNAAALDALMSAAISADAFANYETALSQTRAIAAEVSAMLAELEAEAFAEERDAA